MTPRTVVHYTDSRELGGTERALLVLATGLAATGRWRPIIAHHGYPELEQFVEEAGAGGIETVRLPSPRGNLPLGVLRLATALRPIHADILHAHLPWPGACRRALLAAAAARVAGIVASAQLFFPIESRWQRARVRMVPVDRYVAVSAAVADGLAGLGIPRRRISVVYNAGASVSAEPRIRHTRQAGDRPVVIASVGRLVTQKGHDVLLDAMVDLPRAVLVIAGDGPLRADLEARAEAAGIADRVRFLGHLSDVSTLLDDADVFALMSRNEGLPLAIVEAMAAGLPVVATRVGGTAELVKDGETGILVEPGDVGAGRAALRRLVEDPGLAAKMGRIGQQVAREHFSVEAMVTGVEAVYGAVSPGPPAARAKRAPHTASQNALQIESRGASSTEEARNALLRSADWRFLLPEPAPHRTLCAPDSPLGPAAGAISNSVVAADEGPIGCDLAVLVDPGRATLKAAWSSLRPGGACYVEWRGLQAFRRARLERRLTAAGFVGARSYWAWPRLSAPRAWLPLGSQGPIRHFLATRPGRRTIRGRVLHAMAHRVVRHALGAGIAAPIAVVARKPGGDPHDGSDEVRFAYPLWARAAARSERDLTWLLLTGGPRSISKAVGLLFSGEGAVPPLAVKMNRTPEARAGILREAAILDTIERERPSLAGVPRLRWADEHDELAFVAESAVVGTPLWAHLTPEAFGRQAIAVTDWLINLAGDAQPVGSADWWGRLVQPVQATFEADFGPVLTHSELVAGRAIVGGLRAGGPLPLVIEHRDLAPWNVVQQASGLGFLDWESAEPSGLPALDLIYFLTYAAFYLERAFGSAAFEQAYRNVRDPSSPIGSVAHASLATYCASLGVDPSSLPALHLLCWMVHARSEHRRLVEDAGGPPSVHALRGAVLPLLWRTELEMIASR